MNFRKVDPEKIKKIEKYFDFVQMTTDILKIDWETVFLEKNETEIEIAYGKILKDIISDHFISKRFRNFEIIEIEEFIENSFNIVVNYFMIQEINARKKQIAVKILNYLAECINSK
ncbi:hypothetical protein NEF87_004835 [Candidatus Lokiarchaeum ossiferum]|uniref:Uncharacterized protein n=1 Tax=Candidatus Lokiarchaeum ossiferum TaxID=2951803 RepID=A0ABY6HYD6_9ARCH|nr:hypothetical protein NEF87_004835 [Candidatus Lokiarchaeum sp. B-35]